MKKTLAAFLAVVMMLALAPSVFAGGSLMDTLIADSGSLQAEEYNFSRITFNANNTKIEDGVYIIAAGEDPITGDVYAMGDSFISDRNTGVKAVPFTADDDEVITVTDSNRDVFWEVINQKNGGFTLRNAGNGKYLANSGTTESNMMAWINVETVWNVSVNGDNVSIQPVLEGGNSRALDFDIENKSFTMPRANALKTVLRLYKYDGKDVIVTPVPTAKPDIPTEGNMFVAYDMSDIIDYGNPIDDGIYLITSEYEGETYAMTNNVIDGVTAGIKYMGADMINPTVGKDADMNDVSLIMDPANSMRWEIRQTAGGYTIKNVIDDKYVSVVPEGTNGLTVLRYIDEPTVWTAEINREPVNGEVVDPFFLFLSSVRNPLQSNYQLFAYDTTNHRFSLTYQPRVGIQLYKLTGEEGIITAAPETTAPEETTTVPTGEPTVEPTVIPTIAPPTLQPEPIGTDRFDAQELGESLELGTYVISIVDLMGQTRAMNAESVIGFGDALGSTIVTPQLIPDGLVIMDPDTDLRWVIEPQAEAGQYKLRNSSNNQYLTGCRTYLNPEGEEVRDIGLYFGDGDSDYAVWTIDKVRQTYDYYTFKCMGSVGRNAYLAYEPDAFSLYTNQRYAFTLYKFTGTTEAPITSGDPATTNPVTSGDPTVKTYTVTFADWDGTELAQVEVEEGKAAEAPEEPTRENWVFIGWDNDFSEVTENMVVTAQYRKLGDANGDNDVNAADATLALRYAVGNGDLNDLQKAALDMNHNGQVEAGDATIILRHAVGSGVIDYGPELPVLDDDKK